MSLFSRWFKAKTAPVAKATKVAKTKESAPDLMQQTPQELAAFAVAAKDDKLRSEAIAQLDYSPELLQLTLNPDSRVHLPARKRLAELLEQERVTTEQLRAEVSNQADLLALVGFSRVATLTVITSINDVDLLQQLACEGTTTQIRQAAAARITDRESLEQVCKHAQGKDKSVYKIVKTTLDAIKADESLRLEAQATLTQICEKLEKLARLEADNLFKAKLELLVSEWQPIAKQADAELQQRYAAALEACQQQLAVKVQHQVQQEEQAVFEQQANTFVHTAVRDLHQLIAELYGLEELAPEQAAVYQQQLADLQRALAIASGADLSPTPAHEAFATAHDHASELLAALAQDGTIKHLSQLLTHDSDGQAGAAYQTLQKHVTAARRLYADQLPESLQTAVTVSQDWQTRKKLAEQQHKKLFQDITELTRKGLRAAEQGMVRKARGCYNEAHEKCAKLTTVPPGIQNKVDELQQAIERLSDWHEFAVTPKKTALITQMQGLISSPLDPADVAEKIHALQDEWKSLSRGVQQDDEELWQEFQQASQLAFAPCKEYFDAQAQLRTANLEQRRELVTQLENYLAHYDWSAPVWRDVEQTLKVARQEWLSYWPVPRKAAEELQTQFDALMDQLYQKIKAHQRDNKTAKLQLIEQAQACAAIDDLGRAIEQAKRLQAQWKTIGKTFAREDQQLWREFRKHCDAVFARRAEEIAAANQQRQAQVDQAEQLIAQVNQLDDQLGAEPADYAKIQSTLDQLNSEFTAVPLPKEKARELSEKFATALSKVQRKIVTERNRAAIQGWQDLFSLSDRMRHYELAVLAKAGDLEQQRAALRQHLENLPALPEGGADILQQRFVQADQLCAQTQEQNQHALRMLCIRAEILLDQESPAEDRNMRMNYLMQQLQQGLGQHDITTESLAYEWVSVAAVNDEIYQPLFIRFMQALSNDPEGQLAAPSS